VSASRSGIFRSRRSTRTPWQRLPRRRPLRSKAGSGTCTSCSFIAQHALTDDDLQRYAAELGLDLARFEHDGTGAGVLGRIGRDVESGTATGEVRGTPTLFIDGVVHRGGYDATTLMEALAG
jgi:hypothetical protein